MSESNSTHFSVAPQSLPSLPRGTIDLTGREFGRWKVDSFAGSRNGATWNCACKCGTRKIIKGTSLRYGDTHSCGCITVEKFVQRSTRHEKSKTAEYRAWCHLKDRCTNSKSRGYQNYGERGICVCQRWTTSFEAFYADVGPRPGPGFEIDRKDNNGEYGPGNCHWVTRKRNNRNKRTNRWLECGGELHCIVEWSEITGIPSRLISQRLSRGWSIERAIGKKEK